VKDNSYKIPYSLQWFIGECGYIFINSSPFYKLTGWQIEIEIFWNNKSQVKNIFLKHQTIKIKWTMWDTYEIEWNFHWDGQSKPINKYKRRMLTCHCQNSCFVYWIFFIAFTLFHFWSTLTNYNEGMKIENQTLFSFHPV
jgi:hypothetical protein